MTLVERIINLQSWWLASELIRRHPELGLIETHPADGTYDCLTVIQWQREPVNIASLNRIGTVHAGIESDTLFTWEEERRHNDRHWGVKTIEDAVGVFPPGKTPAATGRSVALRTLYQVLLHRLNDRENWDIRNARVDSSGMVFTVGDVEGFPTAERSASQVRQDDPYSDGLYRFWKVLQGDVCVAVIDTDGLLHRRQGEPVDLATRYASTGRSAARLALDLVVAST